MKEKATDQKDIIEGIVRRESANQAEGLPTVDKDIKIHAADGSIINTADEVKLTGEMNVFASPMQQPEFTPYWPPVTFAFGWAIAPPKLQ